MITWEKLDDVDKTMMNVKTYSTAAYQDLDQYLRATASKCLRFANSASHINQEADDVLSADQPTAVAEEQNNASMMFAFI